ncbi:DNA-directed RNA polymerase specialized sigma24 family protein [Catenulispora sp. GAS73]|uniref:sigma-70 family RNA polymerase sigma factor n=1 Tax=Catenulispora sp. GAS73 TaxID=3156269 RepID=UPI003513F236
MMQPVTRHAAEDLVQGALERAYRHWDRVAGMEAPEAYVRRILANLAADHHRLQNRGSRPVPGRGRPRRVMRVLSQLPPRMRAVLVLRYYDDLSEAQIAEALGVSVGTVKSQAARALARLREAMASTEEKRMS